MHVCNGGFGIGWVVIENVGSATVRHDCVEAEARISKPLHD